MRHTVKIDKDALLQDYGFHISESLPLTVVAVAAGRGQLGNGKGVWFLPEERTALILFPSPCVATRCRRYYPRKFVKARLLLT